jgi:hypothetical protein
VGAGVLKDIPTLPDGQGKEYVCVVFLFECIFSFRINSLFSLLTFLFHFSSSNFFFIYIPFHFCFLFSSSLTPFAFLSSQGLVRYQPILDLILYSEDIKHNGNGLTLSNNNNNNNDRDFQFEKRDKSVYQINQSIVNENSKIKSSPVLSILAIVRKSLRKFIISSEDFREAKSVMMRVFRSYDPQEKNRLSTRDFCFAVSVFINEIRKNETENTSDDKNTKKVDLKKNNLGNVPRNNLAPSGNIPWRVGSRNIPSPSKQRIGINNNNSNKISNSSSNKNFNEKDKNIITGNDVPILSQEDWNVIFQYFAFPLTKSQIMSQNRTVIETFIDYQKFCDAVLNSEDIQKMSKSQSLSNASVSGGKSLKTVTVRFPDSSSQFNADDVSAVGSRVRSSSATRRDESDGNNERNYNRNRINNTNSSHNYTKSSSINNYNNYSKSKYSGEYQNIDDNHGKKKVQSKTLNNYDYSPNDKIHSKDILNKSELHDNQTERILASGNGKYRTTKY